MQGVPIFTNFIWGVQKCWNITGEAWVLNRGCWKERGSVPLLGRSHACVVFHGHQHCVPLYTETYKMSPTSFREIFLPAQMATAWPILTYVDAEQPKFEMIPLVLPKDLVCVPDRGDFLCLAGHEAWGAKSLLAQFEDYLPRKFIVSFCGIILFMEGREAIFDGLLPTAITFLT